MSRSQLPALTLVTALVAASHPSPAAAQQAEAGSRTAALVRPAPLSPATPATHRILTLAWTEVTIPASLARPAASVRVSPEPRYFTLTWQPIHGEGQPAVVAAVTQQCTTMTLVVTACVAR